MFERENKEKEILSVQEKLAELDYLTNYYVEGKITKAKFRQITEKRDRIRAKIKQLKFELESLPEQESQLFTEDLALEEVYQEETETNEQLYEYQDFTQQHEEMSEHPNEVEEYAEEQEHQESQDEAYSPHKYVDIYQYRENSKAKYYAQCEEHARTQSVCDEDTKSQCQTPYREYEMVKANELELGRSQSDDEVYNEFASQDEVQLCEKRECRFYILCQKKKRIRRCIYDTSDC